MPALDLPRAPAAASGAALYESHYVKAVAPGGGRAVWIRCTADKAAGAAPSGTVWCTWFDAGRNAPLARRETVAEPLLAPPAGSWWRHGTTEIAPGRAAGGVGDCAWELTWAPEAEPVPYLPSRRLYDRRIPRSNGLALTPSARFAGTLEVAGETLSLDGWRGMAGHNWGADHAEHWVWLHADGLDGGGWLDCALARVRIGPLLTPWMAAGAARLGGGDRVRLGGPGRPGRVQVRTEPGRVEVTVPAGRGELTLDAALPEPATVLWDYASPDGHGRTVRNCSIADGRVELDGVGVDVRGALAVEVGRPAGGAG